ncbi:GNAT family N-acetyltransferase [Zooshikella harenae]|uniref:GNAT family N-acetyltransferase n=1 Tax=Zooshikella harenae TaxID=2827238 RepID=A0ABS5ZDH3_9GAMM|nr:GNAT family N-acetyltransferase [Zooshikella harenae]MBU2712015.1 GNAT family N-acetyltransferase [Zooshikella harenae]
MIYTDRLVLKKVTLDDIDIFTEILSDPDLTRYLPKGESYTQEEIKNYVQQRCEHWQKGFGTYVVTAKQNPSEKIGYVGIETIATTHFRDIRYSIATPFAGQGIAFEAAKNCLDNYFADGIGEKVFGAAVSQNKASIRVMEKLGMQQEGNIKLYERDDMVYFSIK